MMVAFENRGECWRWTVEPMAEQKGECDAWDGRWMCMAVNFYEV